MKEGLAREPHVVPGMRPATCMAARQAAHLLADGLSADEACRQAGVSWRSLQRWIKGRQEIERAASTRAAVEDASVALGGTPPSPPPLSLFPPSDLEGRLGEIERRVRLLELRILNAGAALAPALPVQAQAS